MILITFKDTDDHRIAASMSIEKFRMMLLDSEERYEFLQSLAMMEDWDPDEILEFVEQRRA